MSGFMPYLAESGATARIIELALNGTGSKWAKEGALATIERHASIVDALADLLPNNPPTRAFLQHFRDDFLGGTYWPSWKIGDANGDVRRTALEALRLALGIDSRTGLPTRNDPISILWVCNDDGFQACIRRVPVGPLGLVTVTFITPGVQGHPITDDLAAGPFNGRTNYACPPADHTARNVLWLVGDRYTTEPADGQYRTSGAVTVVQPAVEDGGVR